MRYIGSKDNLLGFIEHTIAGQGIAGGTFCDMFAGTTAVGRHFKRLGYRVISNDLMTYSYVFGKAYLENNTPPLFSGLNLPASQPPEQTLFSEHADFADAASPLQQVLTFLNALPPEHGFIYSHYSDEGTQHQTHTRMFFSAANAAKIDAIRNQLERWRCAQKVTSAEFYILLAALLEAIPSISNTSGTYAAYLKFWESRSQKRLTLTAPPLVLPVAERINHSVNQKDSGKLAQEIECDVMYLDPPYNHRQYAPNYHILETVARWDEPEVKGVSGLRPYHNEKSQYCQKESALKSLSELAGRARCSLLMLSYNSEGIMPHNDICSALSLRGQVQVVEQSYRRYRSDRDHEKRVYKPNKNVIERIYLVRA